MMIQSTTTSILLLVLLLLSLFSSTSQQKIQARRERKCRLVAVADLHGDIAQTKKVLKDVAKLIDGDGKWIGGCATLVQLGDRVDRGHDSLLVTDYLFKLQKEAPKAGGGKVVLLIGNHEGLLFQGNIVYASPIEIEKKGGEASYRNLFSRRGTYGQLLRRLPLVYEDLESKTIFVHGGIRPEWAALGVDEINKRAYNQMQRDMLTNGVFSIEGPLWDRQVLGSAFAGQKMAERIIAQENAAKNNNKNDNNDNNKNKNQNQKQQKENAEEEQEQEQEDDSSKDAFYAAAGGGGGGVSASAAKNHGCKMLSRSLQLLNNANRMVVGHTPQMDGKVGMFCDKRLIAADVGISGMMMNKLAAVEILGDGDVIALY